MRRDTVIAFGLMLLLLPVQAAIWLPLLPNDTGRVSVDFSLWLPDMLAGYYWYLRNGLLPMPWFSPAECAGLPFHADPQVFYLSLPQFLGFVMPPLAAVRCSFVAFAAAGYWGTWHLARRSFDLPVACALFAAACFMLNGFFAVRMVVGHITYAPFMLMPAFAAVMLRPPGRARPGWPETILRVGGGGLILAICIQAGMVHIIPPMYLSLLAVGLIHGLLHGWQPGFPARLAGATLAGAMLCAGKLAASLALLARLPRDLYPLPGIAGVGAELYVALRAVFLPVGSALGRLVVHSHLIQERHEFEYGVGPAPALLGLAALGVAGARWVRAGRPALSPRPRQVAMLIALAACLCVPLALNLYVPAWNGVLKSLPYFGSSSNLLRWFSALMLPAILGGAIGLACLGSGRQGRLAALAAGGIALTLLTLCMSDRSRYGGPPGGLGFYDARVLDAAWRQAHAAGAPPPVTAVVKMADANGQLIMPPERENALTLGYSQLFCYAPLFGYRLERFPFGKIRLDAAMASRDGVLNFKNPACYVFPEANQCRPGDPFTAAQAGALRAFLEYRPFPFAKPAWAQAADWLSILTALALPALLAWCGWRMKRHQHPA